MVETIFAPATPQGRAGVAVIRISGPLAVQAAEELAGGDLPLRRPSLRALRGRDGDLIDRALVLRFASGHSFTGEAVVELQCHGSPAVISAVLAELTAMDGLRLAEPGEFTRRALEKGQLDLSQVEGLSDLLEAETEAQRKQAVRVFEGALGQKVEAWRADLIRAAALVEATIDFADEDIPTDVFPEVGDLLSNVDQALSDETSGIATAQRIRDGFEVAIVGPPNAGKSTLLNHIAGREAAITSEFAGTTRDVVEVRMNLGGLMVVFLDTAGLRDGQDAVEMIGIERAIVRARDADLRVILVPEGGSPALEPVTDDIVVAAKADLAGEGVSGKTGQGVRALLDRITETLKNRASVVQTATTERHRLAMEACRQSLKTALDMVESQEFEAEILAMEINSAIQALNALIGKVGVEDLLDEIFASFCLGK